MMKHSIIIQLSGVGVNGLGGTYVVSVSGVVTGGIASMMDRHVRGDFTSEEARRFAKTLLDFADHADAYNAGDFSNR